MIFLNLLMAAESALVQYMGDVSPQEQAEQNTWGWSENKVFFTQYLSGGFGLSQIKQLGTWLPISVKFAKAAVHALIKNQKLTTLDELEVIELGAGGGRVTWELFQAGFCKITAVELDPKLVKFMEQRFKYRQEEIKPLELDAAQLGTKVSAGSVISLCLFYHSCICRQRCVKILLMLLLQRLKKVVFFIKYVIRCLGIGLKFPE